MKGAERRGRLGRRRACASRLPVESYRAAIRAIVRARSRSTNDGNVIMHELEEARLGSRLEGGPECGRSECERGLRANEPGMVRPCAIQDPVGDAAPATWKEDPKRKYDTTLPGLSNQGHEAWLVDGSGQPILSTAERADLIEYLKTL